MPNRKMEQRKQMGAKQNGARFAVTGPGIRGSRAKRALLTLLPSLLLLGPASPGYARPTKEIAIEAIPGLSYSRVRFKVEPESTVKLTLKNTDQMMHNLVITRPGARLKVVNAAMRLGSEGPQKDYVPDMDAVLHATPVLNPDEEYTLTFTAPSSEGVYPYVCTFPAHGFVMYGAMYVSTTSSLPPLSSDPHVPSKTGSEGESDKPNVHAPSHRARVLREFMPNCGPAAIAVSLPGNENYCWDAGACRLRYAWQGKFVDLSYHKKDGPAEILGEVYYNAGSDFPLRPGNPSHVPKVEFLGYRLVDSFPEFHYKIDGVEVRELIQVRPTGPGLVRHFEIAAADEPIWFVGPDKADGVSITATKGHWEDNRLRLSPQEAEEFAISLELKP